MILDFRWIEGSRSWGGFGGWDLAIKRLLEFRNSRFGVRESKICSLEN